MNEMRKSLESRSNQSPSEFPFVSMDEIELPENGRILKEPITCMFKEKRAMVELEMIRSDLRHSLGSFWLRERGYINRSFLKKHADQSP